jgi:hypothetical protein
MYLSDFIAKYNGRGIDYDGAFGFQCMDLYNAYQKEVLGVSPRGASRAKNVWWSYDPNVFTRISNSLTFVPKKGDVAIWGMEPYGHIAICTGDGNWLSFRSFDQNWPAGSVCHIQNHGYFNFLGVLRPKAQEKISAPVVLPAFAVRVDKASAAVRTAPSLNAALGGSSVLYRGDIFQAVAVVVGDSVNGNNKWYKSSRGNYVWSGGLTRI